MKNIAWIRFSVSAGTEENYKRIQQGRDGDLERVFANIKDAASLKEEKGYHTTLNVQLVMIPENRNEILLLAKKVKSLGVDTFIAKSFGVVSRSNSIIKDEVGQKIYSADERLGEELQALDGEGFNAVYRSNRAEHGNTNRPYCECYAGAFHACIGAEGNVWQCCDMQGVDEFSFGNLYQQSFYDIWNGDMRRSVLEELKRTRLAQCTPACKLDVMNRYLNDLVHPGEHVNFI